MLINVLFIAFLVFDFWSILARKYPKIQNICLHFARQDGQDKKITKLKLPKTKRQKYGMNETKVSLSQKVHEW